MNKNFIDQIKLRNTEEHLKVVSGDLSVLVQKTSNLADTHAKLESDIEIKKKEYENLLNDISQISVGIESRLTDIKKREISVFEKESDLQDQIESFEKFREEKIKELKDNERSSLESLKIIYKDLLHNEALIEAAKVNYQDILNKHSGIAKDVEKLTVAKREIEKEIYEKKEEKERILKDFQKFIIDSENQKSKILSEIEVEKQKVAMPHKNLKIKEAELNLKERDLNVLKNRLAKVYNVVGLPSPKELQ